jgi:hypothetical protein
MGIERNAAALLLKARLDGAQFGRTLTLGRQNLYLEPREYGRLLARVGHPAPRDVPAYADEMLRALGATEVDAIDASAYEGATLVHDLNQPVPPEWHGRYGLVLDAGTLEHVFDVRTAIENVMALIKPGGHFIAVTPANNWFGHGFFQFSPELFFRAFSRPSGFSVVEMYVADADGHTYAVVDPESAQSRVELCTREQVSLLVHARRESAGPIIGVTPQQSDYAAVWANAPAAANSAPPARPSGWKLLPGIRQALLRRRRYYYYRERSLANRKFYRPADLGF